MPRSKIFYYLHFTIYNRDSYHIWKDVAPLKLETTGKLSVPFWNGLPHLKRCGSIEAPEELLIELYNENTYHIWKDVAPLKHFKIV